MNKLVIIGNGFDLAHGLKTSYSDFMLWYLNQALKKANLERRYEDGLILIETKNSPHSSNSINSSSDFMEAIRLAHYQVSFSSLFFQSLLANINELNWVDIESEYYKNIVQILILIEKDFYSENKKNKAKLKGLNQSLNYIKIKLEEYLNSLGLETFNENVYIKTHIDNIMQSIKRSTLNSTTYQVCFLNFNYTSTIEKYLMNYGSHDYKFQVINIHGTLKKNNSIVFGYGDMMDPYFERIENTHDNNFLNHIKQFYYLKEHNYKNLIQFINATSTFGKITYEASIMGHSCGVSDRVLLNRVFNPLTCAKIKIYYYLKGNGEDDFFEKTQNILRHFDKEHKRNFEIILNQAECNPLG